MLDKKFDLIPLFRLIATRRLLHRPSLVVSRDPDDWDNDDVENVVSITRKWKAGNRLDVQTISIDDADSPF